MHSVYVTQLLAHRISGKKYPAKGPGREAPLAYRISVEGVSRPYEFRKGAPISHKTKERGAPCLWNMVSVVHTITVSPIEFQERGASTSTA